MLIGLSDCDSSGKTTIATNLVNFLKKCEIKVEYRREFEHLLLKYLLKLLGNKAGIDRRNFLRKEGELSSIYYLKYKLWPLLVRLDSNIRITVIRYKTN